MTSSFLEAGFVEEKVSIPPGDTDPLLADHWIYTLRYEYRGGGERKKEPLLLLHGHPQNHLIYHRLGPALSKSAQRDLVITDLRGHGKSGVPKVRNLGAASEGEKDSTPSEEALRARYSKRQMGRDMMHVMKEHYGYDKFAIVGHDRGGRVAHRMALDYPDLITRVMVLDIVPTLDLYSQTNATFASIYFHWFFLIQPYPFPEQMIQSHPKGYLDKMVTRFNTSPPAAKEGGGEKVFPDEMLSSYLEQLSSPEHIHATCEDYRCSAPDGYDLTLDQQDREKNNKVRCPLRALWGGRGLNQAMFPGQGSLDLWKNVCEEGKASGKAYDCGHYMPEELPDEMEQEILDFFS